MNLWFISQARQSSFPQPLGTSAHISRINLLVYLNHILWFFIHSTKVMIYNWRKKGGGRRSFLIRNKSRIASSTFHCLTWNFVFRSIYILYTYLVLKIYYCLSWHNMRPLSLGGSGVLTCVTYVTPSLIFSFNFHHLHLSTSIRPQPTCVDKAWTSTRPGAPPL